ncbi:hypothetical protein FRC05_004899 [Tulasnella sp. 425]|nr:hypothetical protein FRC05_004899 [Tulasnella sp. 425]
MVGFSVLTLRKRLSTVKWLSSLGLAIKGTDPNKCCGARWWAWRQQRRFGRQARHEPSQRILGRFFRLCYVRSGRSLLRDGPQRISIRPMGSQCPTFPILPPFGPRPRILLRKLGISILQRADLELVRDFGGWAWATVLMQVFGGRVTAVAIKYADNIMKDFRDKFEHYHLLPRFRRPVRFLNQPAAEKPSEVVHEKSGEDERSSMRVSLSSLSLKEGGRKSANVLGSPIDPNQPILGDMNPRKKSLSPPQDRSLQLSKASSAVLQALHPTVKEDPSPSRLVELTEPRSTGLILRHCSIRLNLRAGISQMLGSPCLGW